MVWKKCVFYAQIFPARLRLFMRVDRFGIDEVVAAVNFVFHIDKFHNIRQRVPHVYFHWYQIVHGSFYLFQMKREFN